MVQVNLEYIWIQVIQVAQRLFQIYNIFIYTNYAMVVICFAVTEANLGRSVLGLVGGIGFAGLFLLLAQYHRFDIYPEKLCLTKVLIEPFG